MADFQENGFFWNTSVNEQSQCTIRNLISKLALNWLTNVKVIIIEENAPGGGVLARCYRPRSGAFELFLPGVGIRP